MATLWHDCVFREGLCWQVLTCVHDFRQGDRRCVVLNRESTRENGFCFGIASSY